MNDTELLKTILQQLQLSFAQRNIDREIARRERTLEGNAMEVLLIQTKSEECRQLSLIVKELFAKLTPKD